MADDGSDLSGYLGSNHTLIANVIVAIFLLIAIVHAICYGVVYILTIFNVMLKTRKLSAKARRTVIIFISIYIVYNGLMYSLVLQSIRWSNLFTEGPWSRSIFRQGWTVVILYEPILLILMTWFKIGCATDAWIRSPSSSQVHDFLEALTDKPSVCVIMPIYNEPLGQLMRAINSIVDCKYPNAKIHLVLAFDEAEVSPLYLATMRLLMDKLSVKHHGTENWPAIQCFDYRGVEITSCRFEHGGKRHAQMKAFEYLDARLPTTGESPLLLLIDSDIELEADAMNFFVHDLLSPKGIRREAVTGLITCKAGGSNILKMVQDTEYIESQMLQRHAEDYLGSVTCLPGALTMLRFESLKEVAHLYFSKVNSGDNIDFARTDLGEDRYLTHLLMELRPEKHRVGFVPGARCKTEPCASLGELLKQRRRWYLATLTNEVYMLSSPVIWDNYPALNIRLALTAVKNGPLFVYVFLVELFFRGETGLISIGFLILVFVPIWIFVSAYGISISRRKTAFVYPLNLLWLPLIGSVCQIYGMMSMGARSWGGPRQAPQQTELSSTCSNTCKRFESESDAPTHLPDHVVPSERSTPSDASDAV